MHIYNYLLKKSFHSTAQSLLVESNLQNTHSQSAGVADGFLKEWWDVFWDVYQTKISTIELPASTFTAEGILNCDFKYNSHHL